MNMSERKNEWIEMKKCISSVTKVLEITTTLFSPLRLSFKSPTCMYKLESCIISMKMKCEIRNRKMYNFFNNLSNNSKNDP